MRSQLNSRDWS